MEHRSLGLLLAIVWTGLYLYYTVWMLLSPWIDEGHDTLDYFPDRIYGIMWPTLAAYFLLSVVLTSSGLIFLKGGSSKEEEGHVSEGLVEQSAPRKNEGKLVKESFKMTKLSDGFGQKVTETKKAKAKNK